MISNKMENINLIRKIAWSFHKTTGLDWEDLFQEACLGYLKAMKSYKPSKGKLSPYVWWRIQMHMKNYIKKYEKQNGHIFSIEDEAQESVVVTPSENILDNVSQDAQQIIDLILGNTQKYSLLPYNLAQKEIFKELIQKKNWTKLKIRFNFRVLSKVFSS